ncbi:MAG: class II SORL domain-containing protein [Thermoplasmatota archaeon]
MEQIYDIFQTADWKQEKHVPVIEIPEHVVKGENIYLKVSIGKEIPHPNTTNHHIEWVDVYFHPDDEKFPYHLGKITFSSHGASTKGADTSTVYTHPQGTIVFKTEKPGKILVFSYCNIHGLWMNEEQLNL